jgi:hypothetical protein
MTSFSRNDEAPQSQSATLLIQELSTLDKEAEALLSDKEIDTEAVVAIRNSIANAIEDLPCPAGKESARRAIREIRDKLNALQSKKSVLPVSSLAELKLTHERLE